MHGAEHDASWSKGKERGIDRVRKRDRRRDSYRENPMTRCLRDMTLFKVATGEFAFALIPRDGSFSRGIVLGQVLS